MSFRDRILDFRRVPASQLRPHPHNWRTHPPEQQSALRQVLEQIGFANALLARQVDDDDTLELIDGHLRAELAPDETVPVLIVDLDAKEAAALLAVHDPLAAMAGSDAEQLAEVLAATDQENAALQTLIADMTASDIDVSELTEIEPPEIDLPEVFQVVIECDDDRQQQDVYDQMTKLGYKCRVLCL